MMRSANSEAFACPTTVIDEEVGYALDARR